MTAAEWGLLAGLSVLWGGSFFFTEIAVRELPTFTIVLLRVALAAVALLAIVRLMGLKMPRDLNSWSGYLSMGLLNNALPFSLVAWGQIYVAASVASVLNATAPFATLVLAHFFTSSEKMTALRLSGVGAGVLGVAVMTSAGWSDSTGANLAAHLACLLAALSYACAAVFGQRYRSKAAVPITSAAGQLVAATVLLLPVAFLVDNPLTIAAPSFAAWGAIIGLAVLSTAFGYVLYFWLLMRSGATNLLLVTFLIPVSASFFGVALLGDELGCREIAGFFIIGIGLAAVDGRLFNRNI